MISLDINPVGGMLATGGGDNTARICTYNDFSLSVYCRDLIVPL